MYLWSFKYRFPDKICPDMLNHRSTIWLLVNRLREKWISQTIHTYKPYWFAWVVIFMKHTFECHDILLLGISPIKWRHRPDMTIAVDWDVMHQFKQIQTKHSSVGPPGSNWCFSFAPELVSYSAPRDLHRRAAYWICESWFLIHQDVYHDFFVCSWWFID